MLEFPLWIRLTHFFNILFLSLLFRSGIEILGAHPMLYWNNHCKPGTEWAKFSRKKMPSNKLWTAEDEKVQMSSWLALPGRDNLGMGRYWHFITVLGWILTGLIYLVLLFATPYWQRLIPTSWEIFPEAWDALVAYTRFQLPEHEENAFNALQQLTYAGVILVLAPLQILTGIAMSPAVAGRFPGYSRLFGGWQKARSIHFIGLVAFAVFTAFHVGAVIYHGLAPELAKIVLGVAGDPSPAQATRALVIAGIGLALIFLIHVWATRTSLRSPVRVQHTLQSVIDPVRHALFRGLTSTQAYDRKDRSPFLRPNGRPPSTEQYKTLAARGFEGWQFEVEGLVRTPLKLTLAELRKLPKATQTTKHICIQGWTQVAEWGGVRLGLLLDRCQPRPAARYVLFLTFDDKWEAPGHGEFYGTLDLELARHSQTILAYELNGEPLPVPFGAPLRLRVETQLGFKMTKWVRRIVLIEDYRTIRGGHGGWREDVLHYSQYVPI